MARLNTHDSVLTAAVVLRIVDARRQRDLNAGMKELPSLETYVREIAHELAATHNLVQKLIELTSSEQDPEPT